MAATVVSTRVPIEAAAPADNHLLLPADATYESYLSGLRTKQTRARRAGVVAVW